MGQQSVRQAARRDALDMASARRRTRAETEKRLDALVVQVLVALRERDAAVAAAERGAGQALRVMTTTEGLSVREAVAWCGGRITSREAVRLQRLTVTDDPAGVADDAGVTVAGSDAVAGDGRGAVVP